MKKICLNCENEFSGRGKKYCSRICACQALNTNRIFSEETKNKISEKCKGRLKTDEHKRKISESLIGHEVSIEQRIKNSNKFKGYKFPEDRNTKISQALKGRTLSDEHKKNCRISAVNRISKKLGFQMMPNYNPKACTFFNNLMKENNTFIQHAENGGEFHIKELGYWVDGYDKENNIVYEWDEKQHFEKNGSLTIDDEKRQREIIDFLKCKFIRIRE